MARISNLVKHKIQKQILQPVAYNCVDYHEFDDIKDILDPLFSKVVFKEIGCVDGVYVALFKTRGVDSKQVEFELNKVKEHYEDWD